MALLDQIKYQYRTGGVHIKLIFINISIYLFFTTIWILCDLMLWEESKDWLHNNLLFILNQQNLLSTFGEYLHICLSML